MCCMHGAGCAHAGPINGEDMPPTQRETLATSAASSAVIRQVPGGWIVVAGGRHIGWQYSLDNREFISVVPFLPILAPPGGKIWWKAPAGLAAGDLVYEAWHPVAWEKVGRFAVQVASAAKSSSADPTGANPPQRVALATGVATLITLAADTVKVVIKGKAGNAAMAFVGTTAANVLVATTRFEISQDFVLEVFPGTTLYVTGTTGDHIDVYEYEGT